MIDWPKITVVTPNYNQGEFIDRCIQSVINQNYPNIEYFIIDAESTDQSIDIIKSHENKINYWISEKDKGQSDAINKGLQKATGTIFNWLNADDYLEPDALFRVAESYLKSPLAAGWIGACRIVDIYGNVDKIVMPNGIDRDHIGNNWNGMVFYQPGCFLSTEMVKQIGGLNPKLQYCMDFELYLRLLENDKFTIGSGIWANALKHPNAKTQKTLDQCYLEVIEVQKSYNFENGAINRYDRRFGTGRLEYIMPAELHHQLKAIENQEQAIPLSDIPKSFYRRKDICYFGDLQTNVDIESLKHFLRDVFPLILTKHPNAEIHVYSKEALGKSFDFQSTNVRYCGITENLKKSDSHYKLCVFPIYFDRGHSEDVKFMGSFGIPIVTTPYGVTGYEMTDGFDCFVAKGDNEFADKCNHCMMDPATWGNLSARLLLKMHAGLEACMPEGNLHVALKPMNAGRKKRKKIIIVQGGFPAVSATFILDQITGLLDRGAEIENWSTYNPNEKKIHPAILKYNLLQKTRYITFPDAYLSPSPEIWLQQFLTLNHLNDINGSDIFHVHYGSNFNLLQPLFKIFPDKSVIVSFHGYDASRYFKENGDSCYRYLFERAHLITTPSFIMKDELVKRGCQPDKIVIHRYGVDLNKFVNAQTHSKNSKVKLLTVARLVEKKGIEYSLSAFARLPDKDKLSYTIIGDGALKSKLQSLTHDLGIAGQVKFLGARNKDDVIKAMGHSDIFLLTSVTARDGDQEGLPVSLIEAQAMGLPVISSIHAGIPELVNDGQTGFLAQERDVNAITKYLTRLVSEPDLRGMLSQNARKRVEQEFNIKLLNDRLINYLEGDHRHCQHPSKNPHRSLHTDDNTASNLQTLSRDHLITLLDPVEWNHKIKRYEKFFVFAEIHNDSRRTQISVVIVSDKYKTDLKTSLKILNQQRNLNVQIILVNNGSTDPQFENLKRYLDVYIKLNKNTGAYLSRNIGSIFSTAQIILFLDDDALPADNLIASHYKPFQEYEIISLRGVCAPKTDNPLNSLAEHYYLGDRPFPIYADIEGNTSYDTKSFFAVGGWDDDIIFGGGGVDLSRRLLDVEPDKRKQIYSPEPIIFHDYAADDKHLQEKARRQEQSRQRLRKKHPDYNTFLASWSSLKGRNDLLIKRQTAKSQPTQHVEGRISILIPTYNREQYLHGSIESALNQKYDNIEVLVIDDGSTDNTKNICNSFSSDRLRYIHKDHTGAPDTRNRAIQEARGKYILWLDSDDILMPGTVNHYIRAISKYPDADVYYGDLAIIDESGSFKQDLIYPDYYYQNETLLSRLLIANAIPNPGTLIKRNIYQQFGNYSLDFKRAHDYEFWARIAPHAKFKHIGAVVCQWRWHDTNMSSGSVEFDTSFDVQIKKTLLKSHSLQELFPHLNWQDEQNSKETAYFTIANAFNKLKGYQEAVEYYEKCVQINQREDYYCALGLTYFQLKDLTKSIRAFDEALKINPHNQNAREISANLNKIRLSSQEDLHSSPAAESSKEIFKNKSVNQSLYEQVEPDPSIPDKVPISKSKPHKKIVFYALRQMHLPVLLPVYEALSQIGAYEMGFMAPPYRESDDVALQEGLSDHTLRTLEESGIPFWGHEPKEPFDCVVIADVCYDRVDGWGPVVCIGHGTISKGIFFSNNPICRRENFATVLCVPGPWYQQSFGHEVITHIAPTGFSKMDELADRSSSDTEQLLSEIGFSREKKAILFAPTFNPELTALEILRPEWSKLDRRQYQVIFKLHGATHQHIKGQYKKLAATQSNFYYVSEPGIAPYMHACDILVSDVSSVYVEFFALGKPIILVNNSEMQNYAWYDPDNIEHQVRDAAYQINKSEDIHKTLQRLEYSDPLQQKRSDYAKQLFPPLDGQNSKRIAEQIVKVAAGEIRLTAPANQGLNVYVPAGTQNVEQIEENLNRASGPLTLYTHEPNISQIGKFVVKRLAENEAPPTPLICLTGQYVFPHHWDYTWYLMNHFNRATGVFAPLPHDNVDERYLLNGPVSDDLAAIIHKGLQAHHKVHKSTLGQIQPTPKLTCDGLIFTDGIDPGLIQSLLKEVRNPAQADIATENIRKAGYIAGQLADFYCYAKSTTGPTHEKRIIELTAQLKEQRGNADLAEALKSLLLAPGPKRALSNCSKRVSVIIPYYQQLDTVAETLISICNQSYQNIEIIFVNDGSDDEQAVIKILNKVAQQYPDVQINYYYKDNSGLADTRNFGIEKACGDYILPLDSDDLIASTFLEKTVRVLDQNPSVSFVYTEVLFWGAKNEIWGTIDFDPNVLLTQNLMTCTTLFRKEMWQQIGGYDLNMKHGYEDWNFWIAAVERGFNGANLHLPLFLYRRKTKSMLENRIYYDPIAKEQIVRNHQALYKEITPEALNQLRQCIGIIPPQLVKDADLSISNATGEQAVKRTLPSQKSQIRPSPLARILFVCHDFPPYKYAGAQLYASNLAKELNLSGFDTRIFYPVDISQRQTNENRVLYDIVENTHDGLPVYQVNIDEKNNPAKFWQHDDPEIERQFKALLLAENFDIVHFHLLYRLSSSLPKVTQELGVASICTLHDYWLLCPLGHMVDSKMRACSGPESALKCAHCVCGFNRESDAQLVEYFTHRQKAMKDAYERIDTKISPSAFLAQTHSNFGYSQPGVLPLGWPPIQKENNRETGETVVFGYCGQIISRKGLDILIEALDQVPHRNWKLQIYGEGYDVQYHSAILTKIKHNHRIEYLGAFTSEDLARIYSEIDVAVIPSRRENYPLTLLEALSARVPVVAADVGGVSEMMQDRVQGFLFPQDSVEGLTSALREILENPEIIPKMKRQIQPIKTIQQNAAEMKDIYQSLLRTAKKAENSMNEHTNPTMQAVILAAGRGSRLGDQNGDKPKCLVQIGEKTILERQIEALKAVGVDDIYVVIGYKKELVKQEISAKFENITFIENDIYATTNTIYSLYLAIPHLRHDFFYLNGDVLFRNDLLETLIAEPGSGMAVEQKICGDEEVKVKLDGRRICSISKKVPIAESIGEFIGVGIFRKDIHRAFFENLRRAVEKDRIVNDYFEYALDKTVQQVDIVSVDITGEPVIEIDFPEDLENAKLLAQKIDKDPKASETTAEKESILKMEKLTSIIILTRNQLSFTQKCINSILEHTQRPYELIVVDNGSDDGTVDYIESTVIPQNSHLPIRVIKNSHNRGFAAGNNQGIAVAKGDYVLLMNNDIVVTPQWLDRLVACAEQRPQIGIVGPRSNCVSGPQFIDAVSYDTQTLQGLNAFSDGFARTNGEQSRQVLRVVGFCMFIKRAVIDKIGGMDDRYGLGNFEDDDFSLRAAIAGFESWIAMDCFIHHFGSRTFVGEKIDYRQSLMRNWEIFKSKWGLPKDLPYGSPYGLPQMKNTTFDASIHTYPLNTEDHSSEKFEKGLATAEDQYRRIHQQLKTLRPDNAISKLEELVDAYPEFALAFNDLGVLYYQEGHKQQALKNYETAVKLDRKNTTFLKNLADFYFVEFSKVEDAFQIYHEILEVNPQDVETLLISGHICVSQHKFEQARNFYQRVLEIEPSNPDAQTNLAKLNQLGPAQPDEKTAEQMYQEIQPRLNNGDPHKAIASLTQLLDRFPEFAVAHNDLGVLFYHTGDKEKAQVHYDRAVQLAPDNINFKKNLADFYCIELGRIEDALQVYVSILKTDPQDVETLLATAQICKALDKFDDARDFFNQVLQIDPSNAEARQHIQAMELSFSETPKSAADGYHFDNSNPSSSIAQDGQTAEQMYREIQPMLNNGDPHRAIASLTWLLDRFPEFAVAHNDLGVLFYHTGDKEKAQVHYDRAVQLAPDNINFKKNMADFYCLELGRIEDALQIYVSILKTDPQDVETLMATAQICKALEKFDDARDFFNQVLQIDPLNPEARRLLYEMEKQSAQTQTGSSSTEDAYGTIQQKLNAENPHEAINARQSEGRLDPADAVRHDSALTTRAEAVDTDPATLVKPDDRSSTKVSIVVDLNGIQNRVKECIKSIQLHTDAHYEVLLINRGASKGILNWARQLTAEYDGFQILDCQRHARWAESVNIAIEKASAECVVLIHNDVVMPSDWLESFRACLNHNLHTGVVGPMTNCSASSRQVTQFVESSRADFESQATDFNNNNRHRRVRAHILSGFCLVFRKALLERIGIFDEQFVSETVTIEDFCNRASAAGYQNFIAADTYVYHYDRHGTQNGSAMKNSAGDEDRRKYSQKWVDSQNPYVDDFKMIQLITRAQQSSQKGQIDSAVEILLAAIGTHPDVRRIYYALAEILLAAKRFQDAKETLSEMPASDGNPEPLFLQISGYAEEGLTNVKAAQTCVDQLLAIEPDNARALNLKGLLAYHQTDRKSAEHYFSQALALDPGYGEPHTNLGMMQLEAGQQDDALKSFERSFRLCPTDLDIATNYHSLVAKMACYAKAETVAREAACLYPNNQKIAYMLIDFLVQQGKHEAAMPAIEDAITKFGTADGILPAALQIRERLGPMTVNVKKTAKNPPVSVCMIIKDEEKYLARCLASVKPLADEMIVVDTGSSDRSKDIATAFGAQVYDYEWKNDFAAARNFSMSKAAGEWIFILDGDEVISRLDYDDFNKIVKQKPKAPIAYNITTRNYNPLANVTGWVPNDGKYPDEETTIGWLPSEKVRLFYGKDQIRFEGSVHELVDPVLRRNGIEIKNCGIPVHHYGRLDQTKLDRKGEIYFEIGQKKLSEMGEDVNALRELAVQATILERNQEALDLWHRLLKVNPFPELSAIAYVNMGTIYSRLEQFEDALDVSNKAMGCDPDLKEAHYNYAVAELHCGNAAAAIDTLEKLLHGFPDYPPAQFILSAAYCCAEQKQKGLESIQNQKNTPVGAYLAIPCLELGNSLVAGKQIEYALAVLGAAIESDIVNKEILDLFTACIKMNDAAQKLPENMTAVAAEPAPINAGNLPQ